MVEREICDLSFDLFLSVHKNKKKNKKKGKNPLYAEPLPFNQRLK